MPNLDQIFSCPHCGQQFDWNPQYAGRKFACACGNTIELQALPETETYDLRDDGPPAAIPVAPMDEPPPGQLSLDLAGNEIPTAKAVKPPKVLSYRRVASAEQFGPSDDRRQKMRDVWVPVSLLAMSIGLILLLGFIMSRMQLFTLPEIIWNIGIRIVWDLCMTLITGLVIYWFIDAGLGETPTAILKLCAIALFRFSLSAVIQPDGNIGMAMGGFLLTFPILMYLFNYLFEFDFTESLFCTVIASFMRLISYFGLWRIL